MLQAFSLRPLGTLPGTPSVSPMLSGRKRASWIFSRGAAALALSIAAFILSFFAQLNQAQAAPIGMCSELAESIAAPPPMFPADDAEMRGCETDAEGDYRIAHEGGPTERFAQQDIAPDLQGVLYTPPALGQARALRLPLAATQRDLSDEHRQRGLRPPCS